MTLRERLSEYVMDTGNPQKNFWIAYEYDKMGQIASAVSYYLKCISTVTRNDGIFDNRDLVYECLIRIGNCFDVLGDRKTTVTDAYKRAISVSPTRPEAYFLLSRFYEVNNYSGHWMDAYQIASTGEVFRSLIKNTGISHPKLLTDVGYPGDYGLVFQSALSSWWCGNYNIGRQLFINIENWKGDPVRDDYLGTAKYNLDQVGRNSEKNI